MIPTILLGLGGIGSRVVDKVYAKLPADLRDSYVAVHCFDTDVNDIENQIHHAPKDCVTQTSAELTVRQYLRRASESVQSWFPHESNELLDKALTLGAGQVRACSRLAYRAAMEDGRLYSLESQIRKIFLQRPERFGKSIRVVIISSLAGGTGSGIFLQTALYLRELLHKSFQREDVIIRGAFLLPDVMVKTEQIEQSKTDNIRANCYASMRELYALLLNSSELDDKTSVTIELEYRPDQVDSFGRQDHGIKVRPFDWVFLFDFENYKGRNLKTFANYERQMVDTIYLQLFTPMGEMNLSQEDNFIRGLARAKGQNRFCGSGAARIIYPFDDIVDYLSLRWVLDSINDSWLYFDGLCKQHRKEVLDNPKGLGDKLPDQVEDYVRYFENVGRDESSPRLFQNLYASVHIQDENGRLLRNKVDVFLEKIEDYVDKFIDLDKHAMNMEKQCEHSDREITKEWLIENLEDAEDSLRLLMSNVKSTIHEYKVYLFNKIMMEDCQAPVQVGAEEHELNRYILGVKEADILHPVAARYFCNKLSLEVKKRALSLQEDNDGAWEGIKNYKKAYDIKKTEDIEETAEDRLHMALDEGIFKKLFFSDFKAFRDHYSSASRSQLRRLREYRRSKTKELIYKEMEAALAILNNEFKNFFSDLEELLLLYTSKAEVQGRWHEEDIDPTIDYVLAAKAQKDLLWDEVRLGLGVGQLAPDISANVYAYQYERFCQARKGGYVSPETRDRTQQILDNAVLGWCRKRIAEEPVVDRDVISAMLQEAMFTKASDPRSGMIERIRDIGMQAQPLVPSEAVVQARLAIGENAMGEKKYWGVSPRVSELLTNQEQHELFGGDAIVHDAFSRREIVAYSAVYGLRAVDLPKFLYNENNAGDYFKAYAKLTHDLNAGKGEITPHLDKRWHLPAYLPCLNSNLHQENLDKIDRAYLLGLIHGYFKRVDEYGKQVWLLTAKGGIKKIQVRNEDIEPELHTLYEALFHNPTVVDDVVLSSMEQREADRKQFKQEQELSEHAFIRGLGGMDPNLGVQGNIMELLFRLPKSDPAKGQLVEVSTQLFKGLGLELSAYHSFFFGAHRDHQARQETARRIEELLNASPTFQAEKSQQTKTGLCVKWLGVLEKLT